MPGQMEGWVDKENAPPLDCRPAVVKGKAHDSQRAHVDASGVAVVQDRSAEVAARAHRIRINLVALETECQLLSSEERLTRLSEAYLDATRQLPSAAETDRTFVWLRYAQLQMETSPDEARATFKSMKAKGLGVDSAELYLAWARFEARQGDADKARSILQKGLERSARGWSEDDKEQLIEELKLHKPSHEPLSQRAPPQRQPSAENVGASDGETTSVTFRPRVRVPPPVPSLEEDTVVVLARQFPHHACGRRRLSDLQDTQKLELPPPPPARLPHALAPPDGRPSLGDTLRIPCWSCEAAGCGEAMRTQPAMAAKAVATAAETVAVEAAHVATVAEAERLERKTAAAEANETAVAPAADAAVAVSTVAPPGAARSIASLTPAFNPDVRSGASLPARTRLGGAAENGRESLPLPPRKAAEAVPAAPTEVTPTDTRTIAECHCGGSGVKQSTPSCVLSAKQSPHDADELADTVQLPDYALQTVQPQAGQPHSEQPSQQPQPPQAQVAPRAPSAQPLTARPLISRSGSSAKSAQGGARTAVCGAEGVDTTDRRGKKGTGADVRSGPCNGFGKSKIVTGGSAAVRGGTPAVRTASAVSSQPSASARSKHSDQSKAGTGSASAAVAPPGSASGGRVSEGAVTVRRGSSGACRVTKQEELGGELADTLKIAEVADAADTVEVAAWAAVSVDAGAESPCLPASSRKRETQAPVPLQPPHLTEPSQHSQPSQRSAVGDSDDHRRASEKRVAGCFASAASERPEEAAAVAAAAPALATATVATAPPATAPPAAPATAPGSCEGSRGGHRSLHSRGRVGLSRLGLSGGPARRIKPLNAAEEASPGADAKGVSATLEESSRTLNAIRESSGSSELSLLAEDDDTAELTRAHTLTHAHALDNAHTLAHAHAHTLTHTPAPRFCAQAHATSGQQRACVLKGGGCACAAVASEESSGGNAESDAIKGSSGGAACVTSSLSEALPTPNSAALSRTSVPTADCSSSTDITARQHAETSTMHGSLGSATGSAPTCVTVGAQGHAAGLRTPGAPSASSLRTVPTAAAAAAIAAATPACATPACVTPRLQLPCTPFSSDEMVEVNGVAYGKLGVIGRGGTSQVFRVLDPQSKRVLALKQVRFDSDPSLLEPVRNEIALMQLLRRQGLTEHIIELVDAEIKTASEVILMVMELGEIDLAHILHRQRGSEEGGINESFVCMYWQQMLRAVHAIHEARVIHGDLKPANFLCVKGALKLIDFGIAKQSNADTTKIARDSQVGTVNYMSPESIDCSYADGALKLGRASDVWSLGCILYQMVHGRTPFSHLKNIYQKLQAIPDPRRKIDFPPLRNPYLQDVLTRCLQRNPAARPSIPELLEHPLLRPERSAEAPAANGQCNGQNSTGVSWEQLQALVAQISKETGGKLLDPEALLQELSRKGLGQAALRS